MDENEDAICNLKHIQDAFVFCPIMGSIKMDNILVQGIFLSEKEMSQMENTNFLISTDSPLSLLKKKIPLNAKFK